MCNENINVCVWKICININNVILMKIILIIK